MKELSFPMPKQHPSPKSPSPNTCSSANGVKQALSTPTFQSVAETFKLRVLQGGRSGVMDPAALLKAGVGRNSRDLLVACGKAPLRPAPYLDKQKNSGFAFSGFASAERLWLLE